MSLEDKRQTLLGIFHETKDVFVLKVRCSGAAAADRQRQLRSRLVAELLAHLLRLGSKPAAHCVALQEVEKLGSKRGVVLQSIKEVLQVGAGCPAPSRHTARMRPHASRRQACCEPAASAAAWKRLQSRRYVGAGTGGR